MCECTMWQVWWLWLKASLIVSVVALVASFTVSAGVILVQLNRDAKRAMNGDQDEF